MLADAPIFSVANRKFNVIILAAGMGRRLQPETDFIPKALVNLGEARAIDYAIRRFQYVAERMIIGVGYCADLLENYVRGRYQGTNIVFSREEVSELTGPGASLLYALDHASSRAPTILTFCDFIFGEPFAVDSDALVLCRPGSPEAVIDTYKTVAVVDEGIVTDIVPNPDIDNVVENGFTGTAVLHDSVLLKAIAFGEARARGNPAELDYTHHVIRNYVRQVRTTAIPMARMFEFGTEESLARTRNYLAAD